MEKQYKTDHMTLPVAPEEDNAEDAKWAAIEREISLNPDFDENTVVDKFGTTLKERRERLLFGTPVSVAKPKVEEVLSPKPLVVKQEEIVKTENK